MDTSDRIRCFALLIGINDYQMPLIRLKPLQGAVNDVTLFKQYLETVLAVPRDQIHLLTDKSATRAAIIDGFRKLKDDPRIQEGDAIVVYYAGHGTEINAPLRWHTSRRDRKIQAIVPYDCDADTPGGGYVPAIPDYVINSLLRGIAQNHGNNITVFMDCCHAASSTRAAVNLNDPVPRSVVLTDRQYPDNFDEDILQDRAPSRSLNESSQYAFHGLASHVLLAACMDTEEAHEELGTKRGRFSAALLKLLRTTLPHQLRYSDILRRMDRISGQNPQCKGLHLDRKYLFGGKITPVSHQISFKVTPQINDPGRYIIKVGQIHNVTEGAQFVVYFEDDIQLLNPVGHLSIDNVQPLWSIASPITDALDLRTPSGRRAIAIPTKLLPRDGNLALWIDPHSTFLAKTFKDLQQQYPDMLRNVCLANSQLGSDITVHEEHNQTLSLEIFTCPSFRDIESHRWRTSELPHDKMLAYTLCHASTFYGELKRAVNKPEVAQRIEVEVYELGYEYIEDFAFDRENANGWVPKTSKNLFQNGFVDIKNPQPGVAYGLKLINKTGLNLHVNIYYFMNSDLSIAPFFIPEPNTSPYISDIPLPRMEGGRPGTLQIGYGDAGYPAISFGLDPERNVDVDFLKIYLSTEEVDLSCLIDTQPSPEPFTPSASRGRRPVNPQPSVDLWTSITVPIVQHR